MTEVKNPLIKHFSSLDVWEDEAKCLDIEEVEDIINQDPGGHDE